MPVTFNEEDAVVKSTAAIDPNANFEKPNGGATSITGKGDAPLNSVILAKEHASLFELNQMIHKLPDEEALRKFYQDSQVLSGVSAFVCGGVLQRIRDEGMYAPFDAFGAYCGAHFGIEIRTAEYYMKIHRQFVEANIAMDDIWDIGYSKLRILASMLDALVIKSWLPKAKELTCSELKLAIKAELTSDDLESDDVAKKKVHKSFSFYEDANETVEAALEKAKGEAQTEYDNVGIELICLDYLGGPTDVKKFDYLTVSAACQRALDGCNGNEDAAIESVLSEISSIFSKYQIKAIPKEADDDE